MLHSFQSGDRHRSVTILPARGIEAGRKKAGTTASPGGRGRAASEMTLERAERGSPLMLTFVLGAAAVSCFE